MCVCVCVLCKNDALELPYVLFFLFFLFMYSRCFGLVAPPRPPTHKLRRSSYGMAIGVLRTRDMESARTLVEKSFGNFVRRKRVGPAQVNSKYARTIPRCPPPAAWFWSTCTITNDIAMPPPAWILVYIQQTWQHGIKCFSRFLHNN